MPGPVLHSGASANCPHGAPLTIVATDTRVLVSGTPVAVVTDQGMVAGCPFMIGQKPQPCASTTWQAGATRVTASGRPLLINPATAICQSADQIPAGPPSVTGGQSRVTAT